MLLQGGGGEVAGAADHAVVDPRPGPIHAAATSAARLPGCGRQPLPWPELPASRQVMAAFTDWSQEIANICSGTCRFVCALMYLSPHLARDIPTEAHWTPCPGNTSTLCLDPPLKSLLGWGNAIIYNTHASCLCTHSRQLASCPSTSSPQQLMSADQLLEAGASKKVHPWMYNSKPVLGACLCHRGLPASSPAHPTCQQACRELPFPQGYVGEGLLNPKPQEGDICRPPPAARTSTLRRAMSLNWGQNVPAQEAQFLSDNNPEVWFEVTRT